MPDLRWPWPLPGILGGRRGGGSRVITDTQGRTYPTFQAAFETYLAEHYRTPSGEPPFGPEVDDPSAPPPPPVDPETIVPPMDPGGYPNPMVPTAPGEPGPPSAPAIPGPPIIWPEGPPVLFPAGPPVVFSPGPPGAPPPPKRRTKRIVRDLDTYRMMRGWPPRSTLPGAPLNIVAPTPTPIPSPFPAEPTPGSFPQPIPTPRSSPRGPGPASGGWSWEVYRQMAERVIRDTVKRAGSAARSAPVIIEGEVVRRGGSVLGPIGAVIGGIAVPGELGSGTLPPDELYRAPEIPAPTIEQPAPLPLPEPEPWPISTPSPSSPSPTAPAPQPSSSPAPSPRPVRTPTATNPLFRFAPLIGSLIPRSRLTRPQAFSIPSPSVTSSTSSPTSTSTFVDPLTPISTPTGAPLTGPQASVASSAPPITPTRTRTREDRCKCKPKKRKKSRECSARGQLVWASGPKKGKPAGSRCYAFVGGKS